MIRNSLLLLFLFITPQAPIQTSSVRTNLLNAGTATITSGITIGLGVTTITNSDSVVQHVTTPTVSTLACIKQVGPPVVIGFCATAASAGTPPTCTCN